MKKEVMKDKITELEQLYKDEIKNIFKDLSEKTDIKLKDKYREGFGSSIIENFEVSQLEDYNDYIEILNQIEVYDKKLAEHLEKYLVKETNLIALLGLHAALKKGWKKNN